MRRAGGGTTWTSGGAGGGAKQKGENDGAVRIRTKGSAVEVIIIDKAEQRRQEMREAEAESRRRATRIVGAERRKRGQDYIVSSRDSGTGLRTEPAILMATMPRPRRGGMVDICNFKRCTHCFPKQYQGSGTCLVRV